MRLGTIELKRIPLADLVEKIYHRPQRFRGAAAMRILFGIGTLVFLLGNYSNRQLLWGPDALIVLQRPSLLTLSRNPLIFELIFHSFLLVVLAFTFLGGRLLSLGFTVVVLSTHSQNLAILDGGDNLVQLIALVIPFLITSAHWSPLVARTRRHIESQMKAERSISLALHNAAIAIVLFQTAVVYVTAGLWKVSSDVWRHGMALDIVASSGRFGLSSLFRWAMANPLALTMFSYATIGVQLAFVPLLITRVPLLRVLAVVLVASMHVGIITMMGLVGFGINMIGADSCFLTDDDYELKVSSFLKAARLRRSSQADESPEGANA